MFKKVIFNTGAQILGKIFTASITLAITIIIGRTLGAAGYGDFTKIFVFVGYFYTLADFGLNAIYVKNSKENEVALFKILIGLRFLIGITLAIAAVLIAFLIPYDPIRNIGFSPLVKLGIAIASLTIITQSLFTTANAYFQKILRYDLSTLSAATGYIFIFLIALFVTLTTKNILGYTLAYVVGGFIFVSVAFLVLKKKLNNSLLPVFNLPKSQDLLKHSWPIGLALVFNLIYFRIDVLILSNFRTSQEVGIYGLAYQFFETSLAVPIFFVNAIYPLLAKLYPTSIIEFKKQINFWLKILILVSLLLVCGLFVISHLIPFVFGNRFPGSTTSLQILALGIPFFFISALLWHLLIIYNHQKFLTYIYAAGAIFNIVTNLLFIPKYGYLAASVTTGASEAFVTLMLALVLLRTKHD